MACFYFKVANNTLSPGVANIFYLYLNNYLNFIFSSASSSITINVFNFKI